MEAPQIIYITITAIGLLAAAHSHGKPREKSNFWASLVAGAIAYTLLIWGGFFS